MSGYSEGEFRVVEGIESEGDGRGTLWVRRRKRKDMEISNMDLSLSSTAAILTVALGGRMRPPWLKLLVTRLDTSFSLPNIKGESEKRCSRQLVL